MKILIVDDEADIRALLTISFEIVPEALVAEASSARQAVESAREMLPDVIVLDAIMPGLSGPDVVPALREASPGSRILLFSAISTAQLADYGRELQVEVFPKTRIPDLIDHVITLARPA